MRKQYKTLLIILVVLAVLQIIGGIVYTTLTGINEKKYTYVTCTVTDVQTEQNEDETFTVIGIEVSYRGEDGQTVYAQMQDFPSSFQVGESFEARYVDDPLSLSQEKTDWFTPVFLLVLGIEYAIGAIVMFAMRKKMGLYALQADDNENAPIDEDDWHIYEENSQNMPQNEREIDEIFPLESGEEIGQVGFADNQTSTPSDDEATSSPTLNPTEQNSEELNQQKT